MGGRFWWYLQIVFLICVFLALGALLAEATDSRDLLENFGGAATRSLSQITTIGFHQITVMALLALAFYGAGSQGKSLTVASWRDLFSLGLFGAFLPIFIINAGLYDIWSLVEGREVLSLFYLATFLTTVFLVGMASFGGLLESNKVAMRSLGAIVALILIGHIPLLLGGKASWRNLISFLMDIATLNLLCVLLKIVFFPAPILGAKVDSKSILFLLALLIIVVGVPVAGATVAVIYGGLYWLLFCLPAQILWGGGASISFAGPSVALFSHLIIPAAYVVYLFETSIFRACFFILAIIKSMTDFGQGYAEQIREHNVEALSEAANDEFQIDRVRPIPVIFILGLMSIPVVGYWANEVYDDSTLATKTIGRHSSGFPRATGGALVKQLTCIDQDDVYSPRTSWRLFPTMTALSYYRYDQQIGLIDHNDALNWQELSGAGQDFKFVVDNEKMLVASSNSNKQGLYLVSLTSSKQLASRALEDKWSTAKLDFHGNLVTIISHEGKSLQIFDSKLSKLAKYEFSKRVQDFLTLDNGSTFVALYEGGLLFKRRDRREFEKCPIGIDDGNRLNLYHCGEKVLVEANWQELKLVDCKGEVSSIKMKESEVELSSLPCHSICQDGELFYSGVGNHVLAFDLSQREQLWQLECDHDAMVANNGTLALFDRYTGEIGVLDGKSGKLLYGYHLGDFYYAIDRSKIAQPQFPGILENGILYCSTGNHKTIVAIELKRGTLLWESTKLETPLYSALTINDQKLFALDCRGRLYTLALK